MTRILRARLFCREACASTSTRVSTCLASWALRVGVDFPFRRQNIRCYAPKLGIKDLLDRQAISSFRHLLGFGDVDEEKGRPMLGALSHVGWPDRRLHPQPKSRPFQPKSAKKCVSTAPCAHHEDFDGVVEEAGKTGPPHNVRVNTINL
jgi:hypothetical protein